MIQNHLVHLYNTAKLPDVFAQLSLYSIKLYISITMSISLQLSLWELLISLIQIVNGVQFLNVTPLSLSSACLGAPAPVIVIFPLTWILY